MGQCYQHVHVVLLCFGVGCDLFFHVGGRREYYQRDCTMQENASEGTDVKTPLVSGSGWTSETHSLEDVVKEIKDVKTLLVSGSGETNQTKLDVVVKEIKDLKKLIAPAPSDCDAVHGVVKTSIRLNICL